MNSGIRSWGLALVVFGHLLAAALLHFSACPWNRDFAGSAPTPLTVRLLHPALTPTAQSLPSLRVPAVARPSSSIAITLPAWTVDAPPAALTEAAIAPPVQAASTPRARAAPPLQIGLPRAVAAQPGQRQSALDDPRANSAPKTMESRITNAVGFDGPLTTDPMRGEGRTRIRKGSRCVDARATRGAILDPFNQNVQPTPQLVEAC